MCREIHIRPVLNGFVVNVGCQTVVFSTIEMMTTELARYYKDPEKVERDYRAAALNKTLEGAVAEVQQCPPPPCNIGAQRTDR